MNKLLKYNNFAIILFVATYALSYIDSQPYSDISIFGLIKNITRSIMLVSIAFSIFIVPLCIWVENIRVENEQFEVVKKYSAVLERVNNIATKL